MSELQSLSQKMENLMPIDSTDSDIHGKKEVIVPASSSSSDLPNDCVEGADNLTVARRDLSDGSMRLNMVKKIQDSSKMPAQCVGYAYHCQLCNSFLRDKKSVFYHTRSEGHVERLEEKCINRVCNQLPSATPTQLSAMSRLVEELFQNHSAQTNGQDEVRERVVLELDRLVKPLYPDTSVQVFGSTHMGFALSSSDVNINVNIDNTELNQKDIPKVFIEILRTLEKQDRSIYKNVRIDFYSQMKIPRICFYHIQSELECEIRVGSYAPCQLSSLLKLYGEIDPRVTKLCIAMKYWAKVFRVDRYLQGHYPSIVILLMTIHYLQQTTPPVLPVLHEICEASDGDSEDGDGAEFEPEYSQLVDAAKDWKSSNCQSLGELIHGMFRYYAFEFNHSLHAISIRQSKLLSRAEQGWGSAKLAVEDPVIVKNNISRASGSDKVYEYLMNCFKLTYLHLMQVKRKLNKIVKGIVEGSLEELPTVDEAEEREDKGNEEAESDTGATGKDQECNNEDKEEVESDTGKDKQSLLGGNETDGVRNLTEEILKESEKTREKEERVGKKAKRSRRETAQLLKALEQVLLDEDESKGYTFNEKDFNTLFKSFPIACLLCRRARHIAQNCPDENVPKLSRNIVLPPWEFLERLSTVLSTYTKEVMLRPDEEGERKKIKDRVLQDVNILYPKATLELFGSSANGFGHCNSDLDLCLLMNEKYECEKVEIIEKLGKSLKKNGFYSRVSWISSARVPIIKLSINRWDVDCDISMENCLALQNTKMLAAYASIDTRVRILGYTVKCFAKVCDMCDAATGSLSSYAYILMLIHYLQRVNVLPVLQQLVPPPCNPSEPVIDGWNCYFFNPRNISELFSFWRPSPNHTSVADLWLGFLVYYSRDFDWKNHVVTIRQVNLLTKFEKSWNSKPMAIEDPFNLDHNLAQAVSARMRMYILMRFQKAVYHHCRARMWNDIDDVMNYDALCAGFKSPKFMICDKCNKRGHKAIECPNAEQVAQNSSATKKKSKAQIKSSLKGADVTVASGGEKSKNKEKSDDTKNTPTSLQESVGKNEATTATTESPLTQRNNNGNQSSSVQNNNNRGEMTRSQIRQELIEYSGGSVEELKKIRVHLKAKAYSSKGTSLDKKRIGVLSDLIRKMQRDKKRHFKEDDDEDLEEDTTIPVEHPPMDTPAADTSSVKKNAELDLDPKHTKSSSSSDSPSNARPRRNHKKKEEVTLRVVDGQRSGSRAVVHVQQARVTDRRIGPVKSEPVLIRPNMRITPMTHRSSPIAVPHTSLPLNIQPQRPHPHMQMGLLPSPPQYIPPLQGSPPITLPLRVHSTESPLIRQSPPTMPPGSFPPSFMHVPSPVRNSSLLPHPPGAPWHGGPWQPPRRYM